MKREGFGGVFLCESDIKVIVWILLIKVVRLVGMIGDAGLVLRLPLRLEVWELHLRSGLLLLLSQRQIER